MNTEYVQIPINEMNTEDLEKEHEKLIDILSFLTNKDFSGCKSGSKMTRSELENKHTMYLEIIETILNKDRQLKKNQDGINDIGEKLTRLRDIYLKPKPTNTCTIS